MLEDKEDPDLGLVLLGERLKLVPKMTFYFKIWLRGLYIFENYKRDQNPVI